ncbi:hypothetical protein KIW84_077003 [Lathyrus oleraceus]|uniref:Uncharacterized protein n=1 Tax=Pisum sativum TaxID=3888 RepID=A0A9D4VZQ7_PEA|nr:hypothetical protein KIW84_077003 [Pisum sativum]
MINFLDPKVTNCYRDFTLNKDVSNYVTDKGDVINKDDYMEVDDDNPFANIMKTIIYNITKSRDKATQEKYDVVNNVSDNIDDVVNDYASANECYIPKNNEVHDGSAPFNKGVIKDSDGKRMPTNVYISPVDNMSFHFNKSVLKWKYLYHERTTFERKLLKEALTF